MLNDSFQQLVDTILTMNPLQRRKTEAFLQEGDETFRRRAQRFTDSFGRACTELGLSMDDVARAYGELCKDMLVEQIKFQKTGRYSLSCANEAYASIYFSADKMARYMMGLAVSQFLWPNHYGLFNFFLDSVSRVGAKKYLEIGPGHGLLFAEAVSALGDAEAMAIDLSPTSVEFTRAMISAYGLDSRCQVLQGDFNNLPSGNYDLVALCEVLEHVDDPAEMLGSVKRLVKHGGHLFITTCSNCPAIDHVYLYTSVDQIRTQLHDSGFQIIDEVAYTIDNLPKMANREKVTGCNYGALLRIANN